MRRHALLLCVLSLLAAGCGIPDPYNDPQAQRERAAADRASKAATATPTTTPIAPPAATTPVAPRAATTPVAPRAATPVVPPARTPADLLRLAGRLTGEWTDDTVSGNYSALAAMSVEPARSDFLEAAEQATVDPQGRPSMRSTATVEAAEVRGSGDRRDGLLVTREQVTGETLAKIAPQYKVTTAVLRRSGSRWVIERWSPQP